MENFNKFGWVIAVIIAIIAPSFYTGSSLLGGSTDSGYNATANGVYAVDGTTVIDGSGNWVGAVNGTSGVFSGAISAVAATFSGLLTTNGGTLRSNSLATSTGSATLNVSYLAGYDTVIVTPTGAAGAKTLTFFASSTASTWLPTAGDMQETCFLNASTSVATLVFAAGTGIDLQVATSTGGTGGAFDLTIAPDSTGCFKFIRKAATASAFDIEANLVEYGDAD